MYKSEKISELIAEYRVINKKATYEQIAEEIGISKNSLMNYASGKAKPTVEMLEKIAIRRGAKPRRIFSSSFPGKSHQHIFPK